MPTTFRALENPLCFICQRIHLLPLNGPAFLSGTSSHIKKQTKTKQLGRLSYQQSNLLFWFTNRWTKSLFRGSHGHRTPMKIMFVVLFWSLLLSLQSECVTACQSYVELHACRLGRRCGRRVSFCRFTVLGGACLCVCCVCVCPSQLSWHPNLLWLSAFVLSACVGIFNQ